MGICVLTSNSNPEVAFSSLTIFCSRHISDEMNSNTEFMARNFGFVNLLNRPHTLEGSFFPCNWSDDLICI